MARARSKSVDQETQRMLADEHLALALQNEEFLKVLKDDKDFMDQLERGTIYSLFQSEDKFKIFIGRPLVARGFLTSLVSSMKSYMTSIKFKGKRLWIQCKGKGVGVYSLLQVGMCRNFSADFTQYLSWQACSSMCLSQNPGGGHTPLCSLLGAPYL